jgi:IS30 family transposase
VGSIRLSEREVAEIWERRARGESFRSMSRRMGRSSAALRAIVAAAGGRRPSPVARSPLRLSVAEREEISRGLEAGQCCAAIARVLGRAASTISREVRRNGGRTRYRAHRAEVDTAVRTRRPKQAKLARCARLRAEVEARLGQRWSPQQVAVSLRRDFPDSPEMWVSTETIYLSLFVQGRGALRKELASCLRTGRAQRRQQRKGFDGRGQLIGMVSVSERPAEAADRAVPGHWEGDLIMGSACRSAIGTLVERSTRYVMLLHLPDGHSAEQVRAALVDKVITLPEHLRRSLTWDQGKEMAEHVQFSIDTGVQVYFCDPHSPWQRGSNENTNGLLRQYFPKSTDLSGFTAAELDAVAHQLNGRPRQTLGWMTPSQKLAELVR